MPVRIPNPTPIPVADSEADADSVTHPLESGHNRSVARPRKTKCGRLVVTSDVPGLLGTEFLLRRQRTTLGRASGDILLSHRSVSRTHAVITRDATTRRYVIADLGSTNGVRVNGNPYGKVELRAGDYVDLGWVRFRFVGPEESFLFSRDVHVTRLPTSRKRTPRRRGARRRRRS